MAYLDHFARSRSIFQGLEARGLVASDREWIEGWNPGMLHRYRDWRHAAANIFRLANANGFDAFLLRENRASVAKGIATHIYDQGVVHPTEGLIKATDVDYWLRADATPELHDEVAAAVAYSSAKKMLGFRNGGSRSGDRPKKGMHRIMTTIEVDHPHPPVGFINPDNRKLWPRLEPVGEPAVLSMPNGRDDPLGLTKGGKVVQLYVGEGLIQEGDMR